MLCPAAHPQALNVSDHFPVEVEVELSCAVRGVQPVSLATPVRSLLLLLPLLSPQLGLVA